MNQLAHIIHGLVTDKSKAPLSSLSLEEQAAILELKPLLTLNPQKLSEYLKNEPIATDWWVSLSPNATFKK